jgi:hypothetical protein
MPLFTLSEVEALVQAGEREGLTLDYKGDFTNDLERAKKELARDVAAFANSQGGTLVLGVEEHNGLPVWPPVGVPQLLNGRQKIGDWLGQTLNQNIAQRVSFTIRQLDLEESDRCVLILDVPVSARMPHMVTYQQDPRLNRRYYRRHQVESLPAEEYEVREMFLRSLRFSDEVAALLERRRYLDRFDSGFCINDRPALLSHYDQPQAAAPALAVLAAAPVILVPDAIDLTSSGFKQWLDRGSRVVLGASRPVLDGRLFMERVTSQAQQLERWEEFLFVGRNGFVEYGTALPFGVDHHGRPYMNLKSLMGRFWAFVATVSELYRLAGITGGWRLWCNVRNAGGRFLIGFGERWADYPHGSQPSLDEHLQVAHEIANADLDDEMIAQLVRDTDLRLEAAFGYEGPPRSFHHPHHPGAKDMPLARLFAGHDV